MIACIPCSSILNSDAALIPQNRSYLSLNCHMWSGARHPHWCFRHISAASHNSVSNSASEYFPKLPPFERLYLFFKCLSCGIGYCHMWSAARAAALLAAGFCCLGKNAMSRTFLSSKSRRRGVRVRENTLFELWSECKKCFAYDIRQTFSSQPP